MLKDRAQHVVLAVATFDAEGRLLVSQSGLMPCQTITRQFNQRVQFLKASLLNSTDGFRHSMMSSTRHIQFSIGSSEYRGTGLVSSI